MEFKPSHYQKTVERWLLHGKGHAVVKAVAGSGKTSTLVWLAQHVEEGLFIAFNRHIAEELGKRLRETRMVAKTIHSVGYGMLAGHLGKLNVKANKYAPLIRRVVAQMTGLDKMEQQEMRKDLKQLIEILRVTLTDPTDRQAVQRLCVHYGIRVDPRLEIEAISILTAGEALAKAGLIDYTDMIYLPVVWGLTPPQVAWVFVDEAQDLNACQFDIARRCVRSDGRMLFVGDNHQAIYGFAGADANSFEEIRTQLDATMLPLSICYRCPRSHLDLARKIVPQIEAAPGAIAGIVEDVSRESLITRRPERTTGGIARTVDRIAFQEQDLILCRTNAPLVKLCIQLIVQKRHARVRGRDIGRGLVKLLEEVTQFPGFTYQKIVLALDNYRMERATFLEANDASESAVESMHDRVDCLVICAREFGLCRSVDELSREIAGLFEDHRSTIYLSSVHRAKGLEADRVFILHPDKMPLVWPAQLTWEYEQEMNLKYVALTRAKKALYFIQGEGEKVERETEDTTTENTQDTAEELLYELTCTWRTHQDDKPYMSKNQKKVVPAELANRILTHVITHIDAEVDR